jgi:two-component system response regulator FixJ
MPDNSTVCIVDDDQAVLAALTMLLTADGYAVRAHESVRTFLDMIEQDDCGCLVTHVRMPGMSGLDLLAKMKERRVSMPVIVTTAHGDVSLAVAAMKQGAINFFEKPFDGDALLDSIRAALAREESEAVPDTETQMLKERFPTLSKREKEVLAGLLNGQPNKTIANELGISMRRRSPPRQCDGENTGNQLSGTRENGAGRFVINCMIWHINTNRRESSFFSLCIVNIC